MKLLFSLSLITCIFVNVLAENVPFPVSVLSDCETLSGWTQRAELTTDATHGRFSISTDLPAGKKGFLTLNHASTGIDLSKSQTLSFWWKIEGSGLKNFMIKVRNYPIAEGLEAVYLIWEGNTAPTGWQLASVVLSKSQFDSWGEPPDFNRRYITFRTETIRNANARLFLDQIVAINPTFEWQLDNPVYEAFSSPNLDFNDDGIVEFSDFIDFIGKFDTKLGQNEYDSKYDLDNDQKIGFNDFIIFAQGYGRDREGWYVPTKVNNLTEENLVLQLGSEKKELSQITLPARAVQYYRVPLKNHLLADRDTLDSHLVSLWSEVKGFPETRQVLTTFIPQSGTSRTWKQFVQAKERGQEPILPDFSYAGYHYSERPIPNSQRKTFDITAFGAIPDDRLSDQSAIQKAIEAAEKNGGGIVTFPSGTFIVNSETDPHLPILIQESQILLQGKGSRRGGTVIHMVNPLEPLDPEKLWSSPYMFHFKPKLTQERKLANIMEDAQRESFWLTIDDPSKLKAGMWITLFLNSVSAIHNFLHPYTPEQLWTSLIENGIQIREKHSIAEVKSNRIRFREPLHTNVKSENKWSVREYLHLEEVGVEDICFIGNWQEAFFHHKNAIHDGGWSALRMERTVNSWIRRCSFINWNRSIEVRSSSAFSIYHITQEGNQGHSSISSTGGYGVLVGLSEDLASHHHGPGTSSRSVGTVYWRYEFQPDQRIDAHASQPYANLLDKVKGGTLYGSGGSLENFPNHLKHYVLWNFYHRGRQTRYDFWRPGIARDRFVKPIVVGFHGTEARFNRETLQLLESTGSPVKPESLYEAQLELRLGTLPSWIDQIKEEWKKIRKIPLPDLPSPN